ncbi:MAG TPA: FAD-dependent oxidoreductase [Acidimicrobiaceae bacterium]|nr:FAD-dependent oxidoreductase [Acidimicrobiaceae bacterium]HCV33386.1 FAD-dependent oxidoreductase [Acidimicrobiaceae bacterium]
MRDENPREISFWLDSMPGSLEARPSLGGDRDADVVIVGAGYTGLWTAYHLLRLDPSLRVVVLERHFAGFGASGRNGGWALGEYSISPMDWAARSTPEAAIRQMRALYDAVDDIGRVAEAEDIDCQYAAGGWLDMARSAPQMERITAGLAARHALGLTEDDVRWVDADEARSICNATDVRGGWFNRHVAAIHPARLVRGLAKVVERLGGTILERTTVSSIHPSVNSGRGGEPARVVSDLGTVRADVVVRATEGYSRDLVGHRRTVVPLYSMMVATEPLSDEVWTEIGLAGRPTFGDARNLIVYGQRTVDDRIAIGGRGAPYVFGSGVVSTSGVHHPVHDAVEESLKQLFPVLDGVAITHRWGGVMGLTRDWTPSVGYNQATGMAWGCGYVGDGVATAKLAGQTIAELITETESERTDLPWIGHIARKWEPEPLRWLGINAGIWMASGADRAEARTGRPSRRVDWLNRLIR